MKARDDLLVALDGEVWQPCYHSNMSLEQAIKFHKEMQTKIKVVKKP
jgi:hypothetical protein